MERQGVRSPESNYETLVTNPLADCPDEERPAILEELKTKSLESVKDRYYRQRLGDELLLKKL